MVVVAVAVRCCGRRQMAVVALPPQVNSWFPHRPRKTTVGRTPLPPSQPLVPPPLKTSLGQAPQAPQPPEPPAPEPPGPTPQSISQPGFSRRRTRQLLGLSSPEAPFV